MYLNNNKGGNMIGYIIDETNKYIDKANELYDRDFDQIPVKFTLKGKCAGKYVYGRAGGYHNINYNLAMANANKDTFDTTIVHEVSHYIAREITPYRIKPHGKEWKSVMRRFGVSNPQRCHNYKQPKGVKNIYIYKYECGCDTHHVSKIIHNRMSRGQKRVCKKCKQALVKA